jgi:hypothetical protein
MTAKMPEIMQEDILQLLLRTYPNLKRDRWRKATMEAFGDLEESDILSECIQRLRYEPDAYAVEKDLRELVFFEVEVTSLLKRAKLQAYAAFAMELAGIVTFGVLTVNKHGHINTIDLLPHYAAWLEENKP